MSQNIPKYLKFIELFTFEQQLWWPVRQQSNDEHEYEIFWKKSQNGQENWQVLKNKKETFCGNRNDLSDFLEQVAPDLIAPFENQLENSILTQSVFAQTVLDEAKELLGDHAIQEATEQHQEFTKTLVNAVKEALGNKKVNSDKSKSSLKLIRGEAGKETEK